MPLPLPLHVRVALEYAVVVGVNAAVAFLYAEFARANFFLALAVGLSIFIGFWAALKLWPPTRARGIHVVTFLLVAATTVAIFWLV